jgi:hypothetical protein
LHWHIKQAQSSRLPRICCIKRRKALAFFKAHETQFKHFRNLRGHVNYTAAAELKNAENALVLHDPPVSHQYGQEWERLWEESEEMIGTIDSNHMVVGKLNDLRNGDFHDLWMKNNIERNRDWRAQIVRRDNRL